VSLGVFLGLFTAKIGVCGPFFGLFGAKIRSVEAFLLYRTFNLLRVLSLIYEAIDQPSTHPSNPSSRNHIPCFIFSLPALFKTHNHLVKRSSDRNQKNKPVYERPIAL